jgi:hypothetical protein
VPVTLTADHVLRVDFQIVGPLSQTPDVFWLGFGPDPPIANAIGSNYASLYHASHLLGEYTSSLPGDIVGPIGLHPAGIWKSADSLFDFGSVTTVDFGTLFEVGEVGHVNFSIESGSLTFDTEDVQLVHAVAADFALSYLVSPLPVITSISVVPEPITVANLFVVAVFVCTALRKRQSAERSVQYRYSKGLVRVPVRRYDSCFYRIQDSES